MSGTFYPSVMVALNPRADGSISPEYTQSEYSGRFRTAIPVMQYRYSVFNDTAIPGFGYRDSGQMIPIPFIMNSYALQRKFITKEVTIYDQVS